MEHSMPRVNLLSVLLAPFEYASQRGNTRQWKRLSRGSFLCQLLRKCLEEPTEEIFACPRANIHRRISFLLVVSSDVTLLTGSQDSWHAFHAFWVAQSYLLVVTDSIDLLRGVYLPAFQNPVSSGDWPVLFSWPGQRNQCRFRRAVDTYSFFPKLWGNFL